MTTRFVDVAGAFGAAILIVSAVAFSITREHPPIVHVRWRPGLASTDQQALQQRHPLRDCMTVADRTVACALLDTSPSAIGAIASDPDIEDTYHLDRARRTIAADADRAPHMSWVADRVPLLRRNGVIGGLLVFAFALVLGAAVARFGLSWNVGLAATAAALFVALTWTTGRIEVNDGLGYDGRQYAAMVQNGLTAGNPLSRMRPVVVVLAWIPYYFTQDVVASFEILNTVFMFLAALLVAALGDLYDIRTHAKTYLVISLALCIATARMFAYYPVLIDLGGYVAVTAAVYAILVSPGAVAGVAVCVAVLTREFAIATAIFGFHRDLRQRADFGRAALTYLPALIIPIVLRRFAVTGFAAASVSDIVRENAARLNDPLFLKFFGYFLLTTFGGVSLMLFARVNQWGKVLALEHEWLSFGGVVLTMALLWSFDFWRYIAFLLPLIVVLFARASSAWTVREQAWMYGVGAVATWFTQRPFEHVDLTIYFRDWFPYYVATLGSTPVKPQELWPLWTWRFEASAAFVLLLAVSHLWRRRSGRPVPGVALLPTI